MPDPYAATIGGQRADPYRILRAYRIADPALQHAIKKLLRAGRSHKPAAQDIAEVIATLHRWQEMEREDQEAGPP